MTLQEKTLLSDFYGNPEAWGIVIQTIRSGPAGFTCMTAFGPWLAVACSDSVVRIYHAVTGALKLSLGPMDAVKLVRGSPDGSTLFCAHQENLITLWDVQSGGLIRPFTLTEGVQGIEVSSKGRYLACGFSSGYIMVFEVANGVEDVATRDSPSNAPFCWLEPEEQLVIAYRLSVDIWDVVAGRIVRSFVIRNCSRGPGHFRGEIGVKERIVGMAYLRGLDRLAIITSASPSGGTITIIDPRAGTCSILLAVLEAPTCFAVSRATEGLVYSMGADELSILNISEKQFNQRRLELSRTVKRVSCLPNGTVAVDAGNSGVQLLSLDNRYARASDSTLALTMSTLDQGRIIAFRSPTHDSIQLLETSTMSDLTTISAPDDPTIPLATLLCASVKSRTAVYFHQLGDSVNMQLFKFDTKAPKWTVETNGRLKASGISPAGTWLVTFHEARSGTRICGWNRRNGWLQVELLVDGLDSSPPRITFASEMLFYFNYDNYSVPYEIIELPLTEGATYHTIVVHDERRPWIAESRKGQYEVDENCEWVVRGSERICWIPPGYTRLIEGGYCWAGPENLVMLGEDGVLRKLTFCSQEHDSVLEG